MKLVSNGNPVQTSRSGKDVFDKVENLVQTRDIEVDVANTGATLLVSGRDLSDNELNFKVKLGTNFPGEGNHLFYTNYSEKTITESAKTFGLL